MQRNKDICEYISAFRILSKYPQKRYLNGRCLGFALLLQEKFGGQIMYMPDEYHFILSHEGKLYDVRGNVTSYFADKRKINISEVPEKIMKQYAKTL